LTYLKGLVLGLVLANVGYFLWARGIAPPPAAVPAAKSASTLKLVSEVPGAGTAGPAPAAAPPPEAQSGAAAGPAAAAAPGEPAAPGTLLSDVKRCISIGPFPDVSEASHAAATLRSGGYAPRQRVTEGEVWAGVWVYLPLPGTAAAADQVRAKLKGGGIDDELDMPGPNDTPVMSLGLFGDGRSQAQRRRVLGRRGSETDGRHVEPRRSAGGDRTDHPAAGQSLSREHRGGAMSGRIAAPPGLVVLRVAGGIAAYGFLACFIGLIGMQLYHWFRDGQWTHIGISDALYAVLTSCCVREDGGGLLTTLAHWLDQPLDWLGWHKILEVVPATIGLFLLSVFGNFLYIYSGDRIEAGRRSEPPHE
jgi:hypothetical protein